jgi:NAD(P)-dependent dehydrogenase (short-subunit alcohol dehydrogenase family)
MAGQFDSKVALVTGGNSGIGRAAAVAFAREGARVVIAARRVLEGEETVRMIQEAGGHALFVQTDVSQGDAVEAMLQRTLEAYGRLDYAFNNAGIAVLAPFIEVTEADFDRVIGINLKGVWLCMKAEIRQMLTQGGGAIVNMSSGYGLVSSSLGVSAYTASKHGIIGLTKAAALEYAKAGIRVNAVVPGWIRTPRVDEVLEYAPQLEARILDHKPGGRMGRPEEVAEAVVWLCSDAASFVTGHSMLIDGGLLSSVGT